MIVKMNKEIFGISIKYWLAVILVPVLINILASIPNPFAVGNYETWVSFFGSYAGGIVAAFIALLIAKSQTSIAIRQLNHERDQLEIKRKEKEQEKEMQEKIFADVILIYLYDEIKFNLDKIHNSLLIALKRRSEDKLDEIFNIPEYLQSMFKYDVFDDLKYDIPKYDNRIILEAVAPYKAFKLLGKYSRVNNMPIETSKYVINTISNWNVKLKEQDSQ